MWSDNESGVDLLGFSVHKDLIRSLVTNKTLLPVTVGVFGDWGGGKSSVLRQLQRDLEEDKQYADVACLYFSGWTFEGYDDAKAALITSVLIQLGEHKRFGPKVRDRIVPMLKRADLMRFLQWGIKHGAGPAVGLALGGIMTALGIDPQNVAAHFPFLAGLGTAVGSTLAGAAHPASASNSGGSSLGGDSVDWLSLIRQDASQPSVLDVRSFREDFERLLADTQLRSLVVLVDDLDRCMPDRLIENLEAIRLFLAVPKTAFVIAADERIVRHAVSVRYSAPRLGAEQTANQESYDLVTDYVEKLIQVPYHLPRLSPSEIETYMNLLFCQLHLEENGDFAKVLTTCATARQQNLYLTYGIGAIKEVLQGQMPELLEQRLTWTSTVAPAFSQGLKGNPRQVKRFLNALLLRKELAKVAGLQLRDDVLVKLMLLEYVQPLLFDQLYFWQAKAKGHPQIVQDLEQRACEELALDEARTVAKPAIGADAPLPQWSGQTALDWLKMDPPLREIDLRDYFWVARDKLKATVVGLTMVSPYVRRLLESLLSPAEGERHAAAGEVSRLDQRDQAELLDLLHQQVQRESDGRKGLDALVELVDYDVAGAAVALLAGLGDLAKARVEPSVAYDLQTLVTEGKLTLDEVRPLLENWAASSTKIGAAAKHVLADFDASLGGEK